MDAAVGEIEIGNGIAVAGCAVIVAPLAAGQRLLASDIAELAMADGGQVPHQRRLGGFVVDGDRSLTAVGVGRVDQDDRHAHVGQCPFLLLRGGEAGYNQCVGIAIGRQIGKESGSFLCVAGSVYQQVIACGIEYVV